MRILVSGGTGFIGRPLVKRLLADGHQVTVLTRDPARAEGRLPAACRFARWGDSGRLDSAVVAGHDVVVHLAGEGVADGRWSEARKRAIRDSRVDTTRALVEAIEAAPRQQRPQAFVAASAIGYYGDRGSDVLGEDAMAGSGFLAEVCQAWEAEARRAEDLGLRTAIVRIGIVLGRDGGALASLLPLFRLGLGGRVGSGSQWMSWIHLDDMVEMLHQAATSDEVSGVFNGVAPHPVTNAAFTRCLAQTLRRPALLPAPAIALRLALGEMAVVLLAGQRVYPCASAALGFHWRHPDLDSALADLCRDEDRILEREQWFARQPAELFPFFADAHNLEQITPPLVHFHVLRTSPPAVQQGTLIDYTLRLHGVPVRWQSRIESWQPDSIFVDCQVRGPYRLWHHTHEFEPSEGGTLVRDRVRYRLPLGALGELVAGAIVRRDLDTIFDFRQQRLREIFRHQGAPG